MEKKPLLSIAIPTYNRAAHLQDLLRQIAPYAYQSQGLVEICISSNGSTDHTRQMVANFQQEYPQVITYHEHKTNLGFDRNVLKVIEISRGDYIWTFGDDDSFANDGLAAVVNLLKTLDQKTTGVVVARMDLYFTDVTTNQKVFYGSFLSNDTVGMSFGDAGSMTPLIFNSYFLKRIISEESEMIEQAVGIVFMHVVLRSLMLLRYPQLQAVMMNRPVIFMVVNPCKFFVEDKFLLNYQGQKKLNRMLLGYQYMDSKHTATITKNNAMLRWGFTMNMVMMRIFNGLNCFSYPGALRLFFTQANVADALLFASVFLTLSLTPRSILIWLYQLLLMKRYGKQWKQRWFLIRNFNAMMGQGTRRQPT